MNTEFSMFVPYWGERLSIHTYVQCMMLNSLCNPTYEELLLTCAHHTHTHFISETDVIHSCSVVYRYMWSHKLWVINPLYFALMQKLKGKLIWTHIIIFSFCCSFRVFFFFFGAREMIKRKLCGFGGWYYTYMGLTFFYIFQLFIFVFPIFDFFIFHIHMFVHLYNTYIPHTFPPSPMVVGEEFPMF